MIFDKQRMFRLAYWTTYVFWLVVGAAAILAAWGPIWLAVFLAFYLYCGRCALRTL